MTDQPETKLDETEVINEISPQSEAPAPAEAKIVSLSKANKIRNLIKRRLDEIESRLDVEIRTTILVDQNETIETFEAARKSKIETINNLVAAHGTLNYILKSIKESIAQANVNSGVSEIMASIEQMTLARRPIEKILSVRTFDPQTLDRILSHNEEVWRRANSDMVQNNLTFRSLNVGLITQQDLEREQIGLQGLNKYIRELEEARNELNYKTTIGIPGNFMEVLTSHQIV